MDEERSGRSTPKEPTSRSRVTRIDRTKDRISKKTTVTMMEFTPTHAKHIVSDGSECPKLFMVPIGYLTPRLESYLDTRDGVSYRFTRFSM